MFICPREEVQIPSSLLHEFPHWSQKVCHLNLYQIIYLILWKVLYDHSIVIFEQTMISRVIWSRILLLSSWTLFQKTLETGSTFFHYRHFMFFSSLSLSINRHHVGRRSELTLFGLQIKPILNNTSSPQSSLTLMINLQILSFTQITSATVIKRIVDFIFKVGWLSSTVRCIFDWIVMPPFNDDLCKQDERDRVERDIVLTLSL